ncbi:hypothetical protein [Aquisalimonas sp.]|uniref:hypothetical protein n=1 Tax=Aquisalimonas sp. TaxID=1872621 RepID=UPI0025C4CF29|nr:hypothetical protein [Aquisalimonas sp.]
MRDLLNSPDIARLTPAAFLWAVIARVWPFAAVTFLFSVLVLFVPRTFDGTAVEWLHHLRPVNAFMRELAMGSLLVLGGLVLVLRQLPPGRALLLFSATLSQAFVTFFLFLAGLFVGLLLAWPLAVLFEAPLGSARPAVLGPIYGIFSALLVYVAFAFIHRLGKDRWPGEEPGALLRKIDEVLRLGQLPHLAVRGLGAGLLVVFAGLFWTGAIL